VESGFRVVELHSCRFGHGLTDQRSDRSSAFLAQPCGGIGEQMPIGSVDVGRNVELITESGGIGDVIEVSVGAQDGARLQTVVGEHGANSSGRVLTWIDDHALRQSRPSHHIAVRLPQTGRHGCQEHAVQPIGGDQMRLRCYKRPQIGQDEPMTSTTGPDAFGRVDSDGTVYVRTEDGERSVGQIPDSTAEEALAFYIRRFEALEVEVGLLETRVRNRALSPDEARNSINTVRKAVAGANAVGDLAALAARLDALTPLLEEQSAARKAERAKQQESARERKEQMVAEAEALAAGNDWRGGVNRFRTLLDEWKALPRIDRATDDALWHRFSSARTTYTRRRKAQFAEQSARRDSAKIAKEKIIAEAEELATSTEWGATAAAFRELMARWKAAGPAPRDVDDELWAQFRALQDTFFNARSAVLSAQDAEYQANLDAKRALLDQAEAEILPISDLAAARAAFRSFLEKFNALGRVPREQLRSLDSRVKALESAVRTAEEDEWRRTDPEARVRAEETVAMLSAEIDKLTEKVAKAEARGDNTAAAKAQESIDTYSAWLAQAKETLADFNR
jgi:Domain of Unknown Function (DUF349)